MAYEPPDQVGESHPKISDAKKFLTRYSYGAALKGDDTDQITPAFLDVQREFKNRVHFDVTRGKRAGPDLLPNDPHFDWATQKQMGLIGTAPPPAAAKYYGLSWTGTWGAWDNGFGYDALVRADRKKIDVQGLGYNTNAFMIGNDPSHSYIDMINDGVSEGWKFAFNDHRLKVLAGYSGGAGCVVEFLRRWPLDRQHEIALILQYGDPNRPPGPTKFGTDWGGHGISEDFPPEVYLNRYYSFALPGDMYPNAEGLLPIFYDILTRMEATLDFMLFLFNLMVSQLGNLTPFGMMGLGLGGNASIPGFGQLAGLLPLITGGAGGGGLGGLLGGLGGLGGLLGGLGGAPSTSAPVAGGQPINLVSMMLNIPAIIISLKKLLDFMITMDHNHYGDTPRPEWEGLTGVDMGARLINRLP